MGDRSYDQLVEFADESTESESEHVPATKRSRGRGKIWTKEQEFGCRTAALDFIKNETKWKQWYRYDAADGITVQYRCKTVKKTGEACPAMIKLLHHSDRETVSLYRTDDEHDHSDAVPARGLDPHIRSTVEQLYKDGVRKPKAIMAALSQRQLPRPSMIQLTNFLQAYKKKTQGPPRMNLGDFEQWCQERSAPPLQQPNKAFVLRYATGQNEDGTAWIRLCMATPRLLELATRSSILHADATYKLNWEALPVMVVGTSDQDRRFHPIAIGVCSSETGADYEFTFKAIADAVQAVHGVQYQPHYLMADAADAITNGFTAVFGDQFTRLTCWAHVIRAIDKKLNKISNREYRQRVRDDICELQLCPTEVVFDKVLQLFLDKWYGIGDAEVNAFLHYFHGEWTTAHKNWFEGAAPGCPSTNNCLESTNLRIKWDATLRNRLPMARFLHMVEETILREWSTERDPASASYKGFVNSPTMTTALLTKSYQWAKESKQVLSKPRGDGWRDYYIPAAAHAVVEPAAVTLHRSAFANLRWDSFDGYAVLRNRVWVVSMFDESWQTACCTCPPFLKQFVCKHTVGVAMRKGFFQAPAVAKAIPIGENRKRGRPRLATAALMRD